MFARPCVKSTAQGTLARNAGIAARLEPAGGRGDPAGVMPGGGFENGQPKNRKGHTGDRRIPIFIYPPAA